MIKLKNILSEGLDSSEILSIAKRVLPQIAKDLGSTQRGGIPKLEVHNNVLANHSGIPDYPDDGHEGDHAEYDWDKHTIYLYKVALKTEELVIKAILHEYTHATQDQSKVAANRAKGYANDPYEKEAARAEKNWRKYL